MAKAATISIKLEAQTATLKKGFADAKQSIDGLDKRMSSHVAKGMAAFTVGLVAVAAAVATVRRSLMGLVQQFSELDAEQKTADRIGITADAFSSLKHAATLSGGSIEQVNTSLKMMARGVSEAAIRGTGTAAKALHDLGLSAQALAGLSVERQLGAIADAMQGLGTQQDKVRVAMELFGRSGAEMVNMLQDGSQGLNEYHRHNARLGGVFEEQRRIVEQANDAVADLSAAWKYIVQGIAIEVAPSMVHLTGIFLRFVDVVRDAVEAMKPLFDLYASVMMPVVDFITGGYYTNERPELARATRHGGEFGGGLEAAQDAFDPFAAEAKRAFDAAQASAKKMWDSFANRAESIADSVRTPAEVWRDTIVELDQLLNMGLISWETYSRGVGKVNQEIYDAQKKQHDDWMAKMEEGRKAINDYSTPSVGAVTRTSVAGFSAVQEARRDRDDRNRKHREIIEWYARLEQAIQTSAITLEPVRL